jgi:hypothetical protein
MQLGDGQAPSQFLYPTQNNEGPMPAPDDDRREKSIRP